MFDLNNILGKAKEMQGKMKEAQERLVHVKSSAEAGAGLVKATVNGKKQVVDLEIDNDLLKPQDKEMLQDLVIAAINKALQDVEEKSKAELQKATQDILPNIPGFDWNNFV
jgi:nucleoid-associated protein EbfC